MPRAPSRWPACASSRPTAERSPAGTRPRGRWRGYRDHALAIPREVFDRILLERARSLPVGVRERHRVTDLMLEAGR
jgi:flavin-dependent dehydrogenase